MLACISRCAGLMSTPLGFTACAVHGRVLMCMLAHVRLQAVRQALEETVLSRQRQQAPPQAEAGNGAVAVAYQIPEQLPLLPKKSLELVFVHECRWVS